MKDLFQYKVKQNIMCNLLHDPHIVIVLCCLLVTICKLNLFRNSEHLTIFTCMSKVLCEIQ